MVRLSARAVLWLTIVSKVVGCSMGRSDGFGNAPARDYLNTLARRKYDDAPAIQEGRNEPPVPINKTIRPDYIISLEDGRRYKSLKRHLSSRGLTPEQYRKKWGLRADYPMVAANYAKARSELAKAIGLGQKGKDRKRGAKKDFRLMPSTMDFPSTSRRVAPLPECLSSQAGHVFLGRLQY